jgi:formylglycine-generating enzyme required for sulfatase activity
MGRNGRDSKGTKGDIKKYQEGWLGHLNGCYQQKEKKRLKFFFGGVWQWTSDGDNGLDDERRVKNYELKNMNRNKWARSQ